MHKCDERFLSTPLNILAMMPHMRSNPGGEPISYFDMEMKTYNALVGVGVRYWQDLAAMTWREMLSLPGVGRSMVSEIERVMAARGIAPKEVK